MNAPVQEEIRILTCRPKRITVLRTADIANPQAPDHNIRNITMKPAALRNMELSENLMEIGENTSAPSPLALPDIEIEVKKNGKETKIIARLKGVALFDRKNRTTDYKQADSGYVSAWYLDEDYDGDCFVDCQMFFDFKKAPNLKALDLEVDPEEYKLQLTSLPFPLREYKRIAVKVVDVFGNESTVVREL